MQGLASSLGAWARGYPNFRAEGTSTESPLLPSSAGRGCRCRSCAPDPQLIPLSLARAASGSPHNSHPSLTPPLPLPFLQNMPNVRDHDASVYLRLQGDALSVGGYESNPIFWEEVSGAGRFSGGERGRFPGNPPRRGGRRRECLSPRLLRVPTSARLVGKAQDSIFPLGLSVA